MASDVQQPGVRTPIKIAELTAIIQAVRDRVRARYPEPVNGAAAQRRGRSAIRIAVADLMPLVHARDAAQAKIAAIGSVNPRAGGLLNKLIQVVKKTIARVAAVVRARSGRRSTGKRSRRSKPSSKR